MTTARLEALASELTLQPKLTTDWKSLTVDERINAMLESAPILDRHFQVQVGAAKIRVCHMSGSAVGTASRSGVLSLATKLFEREDSLDMLEVLVHEYQHKHQRVLAESGGGQRSWLVRMNWDYYFPISRYDAFTKRLDRAICLVEGDMTPRAVAKALLVNLLTSPYVAVLSLLAMGCLVAYRFQPIEIDAYRAGGVVRRSMMRSLGVGCQVVSPEVEGDSLQA